MLNLVLDYGHGGSKPGAVHGGAVEKELNMLTGEEVYGYMHNLYGQSQDFRVFLTRDGDYDISLRARAGLINEAHSLYPVSLALSVHYNAAGTSNANGFEVFYAQGSSRGEAAAKAITESVKQSGLINLRGNGYKTTAQLGRRLAFIHNTTPPAVLVEVGFITNPDDRAKALSAHFRQDIGKAIAAGIGNYLGF